MSASLLITFMYFVWGAKCSPRVRTYRKRDV